MKNKFGKICLFLAGLAGVFFVAGQALAWRAEDILPAGLYIDGIDLNGSECCGYGSLLWSER